MHNYWKFLYSKPHFQGQLSQLRYEEMDIYIPHSGSDTHAYIEIHSEELIEELVTFLNAEPCLPEDFPFHPQSNKNKWDYAKLD